MPRLCTSLRAAPACGGRTVLRPYCTQAVRTPYLGRTSAVPRPYLGRTLVLERPVGCGAAKQGELKDAKSLRATENGDFKAAEKELVDSVDML